MKKKEKCDNSDKVTKPVKAEGAGRQPAPLVLGSRKKVNKYNNCPTPDGYDSMKERERSRVLRLLERAGEIYDLKEQERFELIPSQRDESGKVVERACHYVADFVYRSGRNGSLVVEDCKGVRTAEYIIKRKLMLWRYGVAILET